MKYRETEGIYVKQLGINLSVANLEAFALQQGLSKTFSEMSQGEQTLLRYQYLMQATSDAQGDFARTSGESFANMKRQLETNLESIKTSIGNLLLAPISEATSFLNDFLGILTQEKKETILDKIANVNIDKETKIAEIQAVAAKAEALLSELENINTNSGLKADSDVIGYIKTLTSEIGGLNTALTDGSEIPNDLSDLAGAIEKLPSDTSKGTTIESIADGANKLKAGQSLVWGALYTTLQKIDGLNNIFNSNAAGNVNDLAAALSTDAPSEEKAAAWQTFLDALGSNAGAIKSLTGEDAQGAAAWLTAMKEALDKAKIDPANVEAWNDLLGIFAGGLSEGNKETFNDAIVDSLLAMGNESEYAREALAALGFESDDITKAQDRWLRICQELVKTIPELSSVINTQTGEVNGGVQAIDDYINAWKADNIIQAKIEALKAKRDLYESALNTDYEVEIAIKKAEARKALVQRGLSTAQADDILNGKEAYARSHNRADLTGEQQLQVASANLIQGVGQFFGIIPESIYTQDVVDSINAFTNSIYDFNEAKQLMPVALESIDNDIAELEESSGKTREEINALIDANKAAAESMSLLEKAVSGDTAALGQYETALKNAGEALQAVADYQEKVRSETESTVKSLINGFSKIETPLQKLINDEASLAIAYKNAMNDASKTDEQRAAALEKWNQAKENLSKGEQQISIHSMTEGLESQLKYMQEYRKMLDEARAKGVSEDILATLSDGSQESFDYLYALTQYGGDIDQLNDKYKEVQKEAETFTNTLTDQKLTADETYQTLVKQAQEAVNGLNLSDEAYTNTAATVIAISKAIGDKSAEVKTQVDNVIAQIARLNSVGLAWNGYGSVLSGTNILFKARYSSKKGSNANGIDNVPFDGYLALLHQGERVQTAAEADLARRYSYQQPAFDYNAMGGAIGANIGRGNVYLDGKTVGMVISDRQANSYRALERSGWQG